MIAPKQPPKRFSDNTSDDFRLNKAVYSSDAFYPTSAAGRISTEYMNGFGFALGSFTPVKYNPVTRKVSYYKSITIRVNTILDQTDHLENVNSSDYTDESNFVGCYSRWCNDKIISDEINLITADKLGVKDRLDNIVTVERLIGNSFIDLCENACGLYIPHDEILRRNAIHWCARLSVKQALES